MGVVIFAALGLLLVALIIDVVALSVRHAKKCGRIAWLRDVRHAKKHGKVAWLRGEIAAIIIASIVIAIIIYTLVFWGWIPTIVAHK